MALSKQHPKDSPPKWPHMKLRTSVQARENIDYDYPDLQVRVLDWWATTSGIMTSSTKDCPTFHLMFLRI